MGIVLEKGATGRVLYATNITNTANAKQPRTAQAC